MNICTDQLKQEGISQLQFESGSLETLRRIVEKQFGYTLLPELATLDLSEDKEIYIKQFTEPKPMREVSLMIHRSYMKRKLVDLLKQEILLAVPSKLKDSNRGKIINIEK